MYIMSEQENVDNVVNDDNVEEIQPIETPTKIKKPLTSERLEQLKQARIKAQEKKHEMKQLKSKAKQLPIEEVKLNALKYDQLQKQKEELTKPKEEPKVEKPKVIEKKKRIIKKIIYEDGSEDEVEDLRYIQPQQRPPPQNKYMSLFSNDDSYTNLVYQSACDKLKEKVQDERTKYLIKSLMPNYG